MNKVNSVLFMYDTCESKVETLYLLTIAPSEDSSQPAHLPSLIRPLTGRSEDSQRLSRRLHADSTDSDSDLTALTL